MGLQAVFRVHLALGAAQVAHQDDGSALVEQVLNRRQRGAHARVVGDRAGSSSGALKSTRTSTRLPRTSMSRTVALSMLEFLRR